MLDTSLPVPTLDFLASFELMNFSVMSPVYIERPMPTRHPEVKALAIFAYPDDEKLLELIEKDDRPRKTARALVLVDVENAEAGLDRSSRFIDIVSDLQGLLQRNSVSFWGATIYHRQNQAWEADLTSWSVTRAEPSRRFYGHSVTTAELQGHLRQWLEVVDRPEFPLREFSNTVHLLSDSYRPNQFLEIIFLEAWIGFEQLVNNHAEKTGSQYSMSPGVFKKFRKQLGMFIEQNFLQELGEETYKCLLKQLSALQRVPVSSLIERFAAHYGIDIGKYNIEELKMIRDNLMHYAKDPAAERPIEVASFLRIRNLLEATLLTMIGTANVNHAERRRLDASLTENTLPFAENVDVYTTTLSGDIKDGNGNILTSGKFDVEWTINKIGLSGEVEDSTSLWPVMMGDEPKLSISGMGNGVTVTVTGVVPTQLGLHNNQPKMTAIRIVSVRERTASG